jgi:hypothetical protein
MVFLPILAQFRAHLVIAVLTLFVAVIKGRTPGKAIQSWLFVIISLFALLSIYLSPLPLDLIKEEGFFYFILFVKCVLSYFMVILIIQSEKDLRKLFNAILVMTIVVGLVATLTFTAGIEALSGSGTSFGEGRIISYFGGLGGQSNDFAAMMLLLFPLPVCMLMEWKNTLLKKMIFFTASITYALCITLTGSRGTILALIIVLFIMLKEYRKRASFIFIVLLITAISTYQLSEKLMERISVLKSPETALQDPTAESRMREIQYSLELIKSYPFTGVGIGNYRRGKIYFLGIAPDTREADRTSHNTFLLVGSETGVIPMFLLLMVVYYSYRDLRIFEKTFQPHKDLNYLSALAKGVKIGYIGFFIANLLLPGNYNLLFYFWSAIAVVFSRLVEGAKNEVGHTALVPSE